MTVTELLNHLQALGVRLTVAGERLRVDAPVGVLTADLREALATHKTEVMAVLAQRNEFNEMNESRLAALTPHSLRSLNSSPSSGEAGTSGALPKAGAPDRAVVARWRRVLSKGLRHWDDETLTALASWHLVVAFDRGGAGRFRQYLPASLTQLTDDELAAIIDWPALAMLEATLRRNDAREAAKLSRGAQRLAAWWNARPGRSAPLSAQPDLPEE